MLLCGDPQDVWVDTVGVQDVKFSIRLQLKVGPGQPQMDGFYRKVSLLHRVTCHSCLPLTLTLAQFSLWSLMFRVEPILTSTAWAKRRVWSKRTWPRPLADANPRHTLVWAGTSGDRLPKTVGHTVHTRAWVNMKSNRVNKKQSNIKGSLSPSIAQGLWAELRGVIRLPLSVLSLFHGTRKHWRLQTRLKRAIKVAADGDRANSAWLQECERVGALLRSVLIAEIPSTLCKPSKKMSSVPKVKGISWLQGLGHAQFIWNSHRAIKTQRNTAQHCRSLSSQNYLWTKNKSQASGVTCLSCLSACCPSLSSYTDDCEFFSASFLLLLAQDSISHTSETSVSRRVFLSLKAGGLKLRLMCLCLQTSIPNLYSQFQRCWESEVVYRLGD